MKAMILAAGRGSRLRPLTDKMPKPLLKAGNHTLIEHQIIKLKQAGVSQVIINLSYKADQVMHFLGNGKHYGVELIYSFEGEVPYETGGGIKRVLHCFDHQPFIVVSADIFTDFPYEKLLQEKINHGHMVFVDNPSFHLEGDYALDQQGVVKIEGDKLTYANIGLFHPALFAKEPLTTFPLNKVLLAAIKAGGMSGEYYQGHWFNIGTVEELNCLQQHLIKPSV